MQKQFDFTGVHRTMAFVNAAARVAHVDEHHPDPALSNSCCTMRLNMLSAGGLSINDFIGAVTVDALLP